MSRKKKIIVIASYTLAIIAALSACLGVSMVKLAEFRRAARYSADSAFEETVRSVDALCASLKKSRYATDPAMAGKLCMEIYADALSAESAMSALPFATHELEKTASFLNCAGDYAYTLGGSRTEGGFTGEELKNLRSLTDKAEKYSSLLRNLQTKLNDAVITMDTRENQTGNVGAEENKSLLSTALLDYEQSLPEEKAMEYDGKYGKVKEQKEGSFTEEELKSMAAKALGAEESELRLAFAFEGEKGRKCYAVGDRQVCVCPAGVESIGCSRLVLQQRISEERAAEIGDKYVQAQGYTEIKAISSKNEGGIYTLRYVSERDGIFYPGSSLTVSVALDDGSIYSFSAEKYDPELPAVSWTVDGMTAQKAVPQALTVESGGQMVLESAGGKAVPCYEFICTDENGGQVTIHVNGETGRQYDITI